MASRLASERRSAGEPMSSPAQHADADGRAPIGAHLSMPDGLRLPIDDLMAAHDRVLRTDERSALEYGGNQGYEGLREWIAADRSSNESVPVGARNIVLTSGAS